MQTQADRIMQRAVTGAAVVLGISMVLRFISRHWGKLLIAFAFIYIYNWMHPDPTLKITDTFDQNAIQIGPVHTAADPSAPDVPHFLVTTIKNGSKARVYDVHLFCTYYTKDDPNHYPSHQEATVSTRSYLGYLTPGEVRTLSLPMEANGHIIMGDVNYDTLGCKPVFNFERDDLLISAGHADLSLSAQVPVTLRYSVDPHRVNEDEFFINIEGVIENKSKEDVKGVRLTCDVRSGALDYEKTVRGNFYMHVAPGRLAQFKGRFEPVSSGSRVDPLGQPFCRVIDILT